MDTQGQALGVTGKYTTGGVPHGYTTLTPFLVVREPAAAIAFYEGVFGAKAKSVTTVDTEVGPLVIHADLDFGQGYLQLGAANPDYDLVPAPAEGACYSMGIYVSDVNTFFERAVAQGAIIREAPATFVSGDRYGSILDPFGVRWSIMTRIEDLSEEESARRVEEWSKSL